MTSVISQNVLTTFTQLRNVPAVISFRSTLSFCDNVYFKMELKAQLGSCFPFSTNKLHLFSKVDPFIETTSKNRFNLLKYVSLVEGDLIEYENITYGLASTNCCSSNWFNSWIHTFRVHLENY
jgi:hypothetical protein